MDDRNTQIPPEVAEFIGHYVYLLRDPHDRQVFYVGKGQGNRVMAHDAAAGAHPASKVPTLVRINAITATGAEVEHLFVRIQLATDEEAFTVEQSIIDAYKATGHPLTNLAGGHDWTTLGLASVQTVVAERSAKPAPGSAEPTVVFMINRAWRRDMNDEDIYQATRGHWVVGKDVRDKARYAFGVAHGLIRGVYSISSWFHSRNPNEERRWGFIGECAPEMKHYVGTNVRRFIPGGAQNPYRKFMDGIPDPQSTQSDSVGQP